ncbi:OmpP1/FadL family transporter [Roseibacillus ishigakijimensis]|uniref:Outer membrane protein transport protein n=1 Tax=Roseibacillus ishigakijimensis TaxID=454146 RepID=A0A934RT24_9BACT|nr:outer membrane protein transport protein [Roseibacillus ishigakijimensis]MBK1834534.1 outer membrane protein transport protein [Roseibacillus ishigakijimensis]
MNGWAWAGRLPWVAGGLWLAGVEVLQANGVWRWGYGAADSGTAGAFGGTGGDSLATMQLNPAALTTLERSEWVLAGRALLGDGQFRRQGVTSGLENAGGAFPEAALAWQFPDRPLWLGVSLAPVGALAAEWDYSDVPATGSGVSYGAVGHDSGFLALKGNVALAWQVTPELSLGASLGAIYSRVDFDAPFIFQTHPALAGAKVDLDLETEGWAPTWELGALYHPHEDWQFALRIRPEVELDNEGSARADFSAQIPGLADPQADYEARSRNTLPLMIGLGFSWQAQERLRVGGWAEWFDWSSSFDEFPVALSGGSNGAVNGAIATDAPQDRVPLEWDDRLVLALGVEYELDEQWTLRGGWRFGDSPVPRSLVTPLNASITEHALTWGLGWRSGDWRIDASYGIEFGEKARVGESGYRAGEYSNSSVDFVLHHFGLSVAREF